MATEGSWQWVDNSGNAISWSKGEPNDSQDEDCAEWKDDGINDRQCNSTYQIRGLCEIRYHGEENM